MGGEPVARILGEAEFWGLRLRLNQDTLVPRAETETLVEVVLAEARKRLSREIRICDLGTGSGAIVIALLSELTLARAVATDVSEAALAMAKQNAERHGLAARIDFHAADFADRPSGPFDIVVSNPPYIRSEEIAGLQREVRGHDPHRALDGGPDGLDAYRVIIDGADELLAEDGLLALEIGHDQGSAVVGLCREAGLGAPRIEQDLGRRDRVVVARARK
jgi:release factor glutamine methyltransferase